MPYKKCPYCGENSYSSSENDKEKWICPKCGADLSGVPSKGIKE